MRTMLSILVFLGFAIQLPAADTNVPAATGTNASAVLKIGAADADKYYDQVMIVTGKITQVTIRPTITFLNFDKPYPNSPFTVVIFHGHSSFYGDVNALRGRSVEIKGKIRKYRDRPEIALNNTNQLTVWGPPIPTKAPVAPHPTNAPPSMESTNFPEIM